MWLDTPPCMEKSEIDIDEILNEAVQYHYVCSYIETSSVALRRNLLDLASRVTSHLFEFSFCNHNLEAQRKHIRMAEVELRRSKAALEVIEPVHITIRARLKGERLGATLACLRIKLGGDDRDPKSLSNS